MERLISLAADVYFAKLHSGKTQSPLDKIRKLLQRCEVKKLYRKDELVAVKIHMGEMGNTAFIRPIYLRPVLEALREVGAKPYLTDTNTLYTGMRWNSVDHLHNAALHGFNYGTLQVPVIIADGLRGENTVPVSVAGELVKEAKLAADIIHADALLVVSHFKGHSLVGFGGALKNLAMGCASRAGKLDMHAVMRPRVESSLCTACRLCARHCQAGAFEFAPKAAITDKCVGCAHCIGVCPHQAIKHDWNQSAANVQKKIVEYAKAVVESFERPAIYINFLLSMSPDCDCWDGNDGPVTGDIGFLAATDPVAIDKAAFDLVVAACGGKDPFRSHYPEVDGQLVFAHAVRMNVGTADYKLHEIK